MPISSLIVRTKGGAAEQVSRDLQSMAGLEISHVDGNDLVILTETASREEDSLLWDAVAGTTNVLGLDLIYHNFEDLEETQP